MVAGMRGKENGNGSGSGKVEGEGEGEVEIEGGERLTAKGKAAGTIETRDLFVEGDERKGGRNGKRKREGEEEEDDDDEEEDDDEGFKAVGKKEGKIPTTKRRQRRA